ncbi:bifunctional proline dehydrogenase/L-glutamate gamma-semialdehyde dehydrogenase PutA [Oceanibium sediminis]|uniref:bifunctional proline dehydrogenase/L-glutamate gamma-semialdehyde dehydrogenase PutA n=1 Tax=Oceanibium sediminis TaxID=2026339 RepID=UPI000DD324E9|nr:bifunctional proline dehydrogenase/L-glutamate gamma-semialdehyde dehydrogenase PutA [Oceanibium sediminis]
MTDLAAIRAEMPSLHTAPDTDLLARLKADAPGAAGLSARATKRGAALVEAIRAEDNPGLMEVFLAEYGLSTDEGIALMCLAEALLRVPDAETIDALIEDKIAPSAWNTHLGHSASSLVNASTWALMLTGKVLSEPRAPGMASTLRRAVKRLGEPVIRTAVGQAMKELGRQFVLGTDIGNAMERAEKMEAQGYTYSYDMLGEAAMTWADAETYYTAYSQAITAIGAAAKGNDIRTNPGISIKLSALHPRYEWPHRDSVMSELVPRVVALARAASAADIGLNIDAEEADRLELSLDVIEAVVQDPSLAGWDGFGVVVQAYGKRAPAVIDWLNALAEKLDRKFMVRLVKGAYWDTEIKRAQVEGLEGFPVYAEKAATDVSYICCATKLLGYAPRLYPQFATHNAHTVAAILEAGADPALYEFQRLHGMGEALHRQVLTKEGTRCRIYAPVGKHRDLLAYLVRRLLENGANSSFVNQVIDTAIPASNVAADPFTELTGSSVTLPADLFAPERKNSRGRDLHDGAEVAALLGAREDFASGTWSAGPLIAGDVVGGDSHTVLNPARPEDTVGTVQDASSADVETALSAAAPWDASAEDRSAALSRAADLYEAHEAEFLALCALEAGKSAMDGVAELREAVDFLRYYAARGPEQGQPARGIFTCISPWNFPLAIFTGQISAALAAGNAVLAKPAESTVLIANLATRLLHEAGVPATALQLVPGPGSVVGRALTSDPRICGVAFTGSTATAQAINRAMAENMRPGTPLIAETGGLNAMIVDSSALPEQAVRDVIASAFQSAGQRCSALRCLYVQEDVAKPFMKMLEGAMRTLVMGDPWDLKTDVGPVISEQARADIQGYIDTAASEGRLVRALARPKNGHFVAPTILKVNGIADLEREVFGPVLHVATFKARDLDKVVDQINATGYGLTFGIHSRIDDRVEQVTARLKVGNIYVNRNQIGAIVGSQPFGGWGMSGTGPKAGGPAYVPRFTEPPAATGTEESAKDVDPAQVAAALSALPEVSNTPKRTLDLPGPTGESNQLSVLARGPVLCLGPGAAAAREQVKTARAAGCPAVAVAPGLSGAEGMDGTLAPDALESLPAMAAVAYYGGGDTARAMAQALARRSGPIVPLVTGGDLAARLEVERHMCIDTTAAGGNAQLLAGKG